MHYISHRVYILEIFHFHRFHIVNKVVFGLGAIVKLPCFTTYKNIFKLSKYIERWSKSEYFPYITSDYDNVWDKWNAENNQVCLLVCALIPVDGDD